MIASKIRFEIYQGQSLVYQEDFVAGKDFSAQSTITKTLSGINAGTYSKMVVSIFNTAVSNTEPVVQGESGAFTVNAGLVTPLTIICYPTHYEDLVDGYYSDTAYLNARGEKWYRVNTPSQGTTFYVQTFTGDMDIYIFKPDGTYLGSQTGIDLINTIYLSTPNNPYYVCMYAYSAGSGRAGFSSGDARGSIQATIQ